MSNRQYLGKGLLNFHSTQELANYLKEILESKIFPLWCDESSAALLTWSEKILQEEDSLCGNYVAQILIRYMNDIDSLKVYSLMPIYLQLNKLIDLTSRKTIIDPLWESTHKLHMLIHKKNGICCRRYFLILAKVFMDSISDSTVAFNLRQVRIKSLSYMLKNTPKDLLSTLKVTNWQIITELLSSLDEAGDYQFQSNLIESVFSLTEPSERESGVNSWFTNLDNQVKKHFLNIKQFIPDCRRFLNAYNDQLGGKRKVFTFPCSAKMGNYYLGKPKVSWTKDLWVDFNLRSTSLSIYFDRSNSTVSTEMCQWGSVIIHESKVESAQFRNGHSLFLMLSEDPCYYLKFVPSKSCQVLLTKEFSIKFPNPVEELEDLCLILFKDKLKEVPTETPSVQENSKMVTTQTSSVQLDSKEVAKRTPSVQVDSKKVPTQTSTVQKDSKITARIPPMVPLSKIQLFVVGNSIAGNFASVRLEFHKYEIAATFKSYSGADLHFLVGEVPKLIQPHYQNILFIGLEYSLWTEVKDWTFGDHICRVSHLVVNELFTLLETTKYLDKLVRDCKRVNPQVNVYIYIPPYLDISAYNMREVKASGYYGEIPEWVMGPEMRAQQLKRYQLGEQLADKEYSWRDKRIVRGQLALQTIAAPFNVPLPQDYGRDASLLAMVLRGQTQDSIELSAALYDGLHPTETFIFAFWKLYSKTFLDMEPFGYPTPDLRVSIGSRWEPLTLPIPGVTAPSSSKKNTKPSSVPTEVMMYQEALPQFYEPALVRSKYPESRLLKSNTPSPVPTGIATCLPDDFSLEKYIKTPWPVSFHQRTPSLPSLPVGLLSDQQLDMSLPSTSGEPHRRSAATGRLQEGRRQPGKRVRVESVLEGLSPRAKLRRYSATEMFSIFREHARESLSYFQRMTQENNWGLTTRDIKLALMAATDQLEEESTSEMEI